MKIFPWDLLSLKRILKEKAIHHYLMIAVKLLTEQKLFSSKKRIYTSSIPIMARFQGQRGFFYYNSSKMVRSYGPKTASLFRKPRVEIHSVLGVRVLLSANVSVIFGSSKSSHDVINATSRTQMTVNSL